MTFGNEIFFFVLAWGGETPFGSAVVVVGPSSFRVKLMHEGLAKKLGHVNLLLLLLVYFLGSKINSLE